MRIDHRSSRVRRPWPGWCGALLGSGRAARGDVTGAVAGPAVGAAGSYEILRGRVHGEVDPTDRRNAIIQDVPLAPRNGQGRAEYVATFALARPVDLAGVGHAGLLGSESRQRIGASVSRRPRLGRQRLAGRSAADSGQADDRRTRRKQRRRLDDHRPGAPAVRQRGARLDYPADPPRDDRQPAAGVSTRRPRAARRAPDQRGQRDRRRCPARRPRGAARRLGARRLPHRAVSRDTRRDAAVREGRFRPEAALSAVLHRAGSAGARHRPGGDARHHGVLPRRRRGRAGHAEPGRRRHPPRGRDRRLAVGELHPHVHPSRLQRRRRRARDLGRRVPADRGAPDADQRALRRAGRRCRAVRGGQRAGDLVGWLRGSDRRRQRASLLDRCTASRTCPKIIEAFGSAEFWGLRMSPDLVGTDARTGHPAAGPRPPLLLSRHDARRWTRRLRDRRRPGAAWLHASGQPEPAGGHDAGADARARRLGRPRHRAARQPLSAPGPGRAGGAGGGGGRVRAHPRRTRSGAPAEPVPRTSSARGWC